MSLGGFLDDSLPGFEDDLRSAVSDASQQLNLPELEDTTTAAVSDAGDTLSGQVDRLNLPQAEDDLRAAAQDLGDDLSGIRFDAGAFQDLLDQSGLSAFNGNANIQNLNDIAALAEALPGGLGDPDATGEVPIGGSATIGREQALVGASLAAAPRILEAFGSDAYAITVGQGTIYQLSVDARYSDPQSGFSAVRMTPADGGPVIFAIDGLEVGSRADEVAAATLGRLQAESPAFQQMVEEAAAIVTQTGRPVEFVGPSLGGAVAQVAAYETAERVSAAEKAAGYDFFTTGIVRLVTVDPLGGRDAAEAINGGTLDADALTLIDGLNLRTEGDVISRIGSHIGSTLTLPALDAAGNRVTLDAADAHVNIVSLLQNLSSDALYATGTLGAPAEISGFAAASDATSDAAIAAWRASGGQEEGLTSLQIPGVSSFDATRTVWSLDADTNGTSDFTVYLTQPASQAVADLVLVG